MIVSSLVVHPVKGCGGYPVTSRAVEPTGLRGDRMMMLVDEDGVFLSQRKVPEMAAIRPRLTDDALLHGGSVFPIITDGPRVPVVVHTWHGFGVDQGDEAAESFSQALKRSVRLVRTPPDIHRETTGETTGVVGYADGNALLVLSLSSLDGLNERILERGGEPVPMDRFRPNVVVSGWPEPHTEDRVRRAAIGDVELAYAKDCVRCAVPMVDQGTGLKSGPEPIRTLATYRRDPDGGVTFGMKAQVVRTGTISVGDKVDVLEWRA
ncbi:MOSC N-terminal beta barrel domain-containing protein [Lentzea sp. NBRC 102530]|uniref:MOSC domain-containing protein n=1 Tax=Lentzea sp. NBRC 102530 TaxID=3032201 RepID=UPI0024A5D2EE|nr:MOSC N-terminal beta barrel domain-containing protein [Lentzea sp. NBRC 102530]GLY48515.1 molybdenum cofactor sulfurase [Lentzea sp. NBRC 102530]